MNKHYKASGDVQGLIIDSQCYIELMAVSFVFSSLCMLAIIAF